MSGDPIWTDSFCTRETEICTLCSKMGRELWHLLLLSQTLITHLFPITMQPHKLWHGALTAQVTSMREMIFTLGNNSSESDAPFLVLDIGAGALRIRKGIFKPNNYCHSCNNLYYRVFLQERKSAGEVLNMWLVFGLYWFGVKCVSRYPPSAKTTRLCDYNPCSISTGGFVCTAQSQAHRWVAMS